MFVAAALLIRLGVAWTATSLPPAAPSLACHVELQPRDVPGPWVLAAASLRASLRDRGGADRDCRIVVIHAAGERPSVEVVTLDGRRGVRRLADAGDVAATVAALIVTVEAEVASRHDDGARSDVSSVARVAAPAPPAPGPGLAGWRAQVVVSGGTRFTAPRTQSMLLELGLGVARPSWEVGVFGAWAPTTVAIGSGASRSFTSSAEAAIGGAWRPALGASSVDLLLGARAGVVSFVGNTTGEMNGGDLDGVAPTVTAFVGAAFPARSIVRVRPQLWYQWSAATRLGATDSNNVPRLSSVGLSLGVESRPP